MSKRFRNESEVVKIFGKGRKRERKRGRERRKREREERKKEEETEKEKGREKKSEKKTEGKREILFSKGQSNSRGPDQHRNSGQVSQVLPLSGGSSHGPATDSIGCE